MESAKAGLSTEGVASRNPAVAESTEGAGMRTCRCVLGIGPTESVDTSAMSIGGVIEVHSTRMKTIAIDDRPAMRDVRVVVVDDSPIVMPIESPMVPTPAEAGK
jgi:hypothetical protein